METKKLLFYSQIDYNFDNVHYQILYSDMKRTDDDHVKNETEMIMRFMNIINGD